MTRAPVTLSREMKILLTAIGLLALLGGWWVWSSQRQAEVTDPTPVTAARASTSGTAGENPAGQTAPGNGPATVTTDGKTEVATVPPFPVTDPNGSTPDPTVVAPAPSGINPNQPLNGLNGHNPFRPIRIETDTAGAAAAPVTASTPAPGSQVAGPVTIQRPTSTQAQIDAALGTPSTSGGAFPTPRIPTKPMVSAAPSPATNSANTSANRPATGTGVRVTQRGATVTLDASGVVPVSPIPGTPAAATSGRPPATTVRVPSSAPSGGAAKSGTTAVRGPAAAPAPIAPPVTGVQEPTVRVPQTTAVDGTTAAGTPGTPQNTAQGNAAVAAGNPQVMTTLQSAPTSATAGSAATTVDTPAVENKAEAEIADRHLVFNTVVLGPVNTAVFRSDNGFLVATVGQPIPNTNLILKEVTATTATLTSGNDSTTLQLDKK